MVRFGHALRTRMWASQIPEGFANRYLSSVIATPVDRLVSLLPYFSIVQRKVLTPLLDVCLR